MTEERFDPARADRTSPWWGVHVSRYVFARGFVHGLRVLDVACGTGYGLGVLGAEARAIVGLDADVASARVARTLGGRAHAVVAGDGSRLPFPDAAFEAVTSFETLEHLRNRDDFLDEVARVLAPGGVCILSTPNAVYTQPVNGVPRNPFHVHEYTPQELADALRARFARVELLGQALSPRFVMSPFWDDQQRLPKSLGAQSALLLWRVLNKLPHPLRDLASRAVWGHPFVPGEDDYTFSPDTAAEAPVLVAVCTTASKGGRA